jgi:hypothetical protein
MGGRRCAWPGSGPTRCRCATNGTPRCDDTQLLRTRIAACLVLLYAQPVSRLTRLTIDDITHDHEGQTLLRFGDPPTPVPEPFATLLTQLTSERANMNTAANPTARWLFPGGSPGQRLPPGALLPSLRRLGIPASQARTSALRELVLQAPAPWTNSGSQPSSIRCVTYERRSEWKSSPAGIPSAAR